MALGDYMIRFTLVIIVSLGLDAVAIWLARGGDYTAAWAVAALSAAVIVFGLLRVASGKW